MSAHRRRKLAKCLWSILFAVASGASGLPELTCVLQAAETMAPWEGERNPKLRTVSGKLVNARLIKLDLPDYLLFDTEGTESRYSLDEVVEWGRPIDTFQGDIVLLRSGSLLVVDSWRLQGDRIICESPIWGIVELDRAMVRGIARSGAPTEVESRDRQWRNWLETASERDQVAIDNGDALSGRVLGWVEDRGDAAAQEDPGGRRLRIELAHGEITVPESSIRAMILRGEPRAARERAQEWGALGLADGSLLRVARLTLNQDRLEMRLRDGATLTVDAAVLWPETTFMQPLRSGTVYLSDLEPLGYKHVPFLTQAWSFRRDGNVLGAGLRSSGRLYLRGLGMHSTSRLAYELAGEYQRFQAELALDDAAGRKGSVSFRVYVEKEGWNAAYISPTVRGGDAPLAIDIDVTDARQMALIIDAADHGDQRDYANWLNARLLKR
ncbi:MAG: NPCBM/NEW2 domain-containing protein [Pirellulales bacterium]